MRRLLQGTGAAALFALAVILPLLRQTGVPSWQTVWAEDGSVFFAEARSHGAGAIWRPYVGYLVLGPRLLAVAAPLVPLRHLPLYLSGASAIATALLAAFVYWATAGWVASRVLRLALAALVVLMPARGAENTATITNVIWTLAAVAPWALIARRAGRMARALRAGVAFLAAASTPVCLAYLPIAGWAMWRDGLRQAGWIVAAFGLGCAGQLAAVAHAPEMVRLPSDRLALLQLVAARVCGVFLFGTQGTGALWEANQPALFVGAPLLTAAIFTVLMASAEPPRRLLAGAFIVTALGTFAVPVWMRSTHIFPFVIGFPYSDTQMRFSVVPTMLLASAVAVLAAPPGTAAGRLVPRLARVWFVIHLAVLIVADFRVTNPRSAGPAWTEALAFTYRRQCAARPSDQLARVATNRFGAFHVPVTCRELAEATRIRSPRAP